MEVGVTWQDAQEHNAIAADLDHLRDGRVCVVVADDEVTTPLHDDACLGIAEIAVGEPVVDASEVDPHVPGV